MELSDRKKKILRAIVDLYIRTAEPVASKTIAQMPDMDFSSATIRNEMAELTALGYLEQPHTSAGRIPSPAGYRLYVDELMQDYRLSTDETKSINQAMELKMQEVDKVVSQVGKLVSQMTNLPAYAMAARAAGLTVKRFDLILAEAGSFILVVMLSDSSVKNKLIRLPVELTEADLKLLGAVLNASVTELTAEQLSPELLSRVTRSAGNAASLVPVIMDFVTSLLHQEHSEVYMTGQAKLLGQPEYHDIDKAQKMLSALDEDVVSNQPPRGALLRQPDADPGRPGKRVEGAARHQRRHDEVRYRRRDAGLDRRGRPDQNGLRADHCPAELLRREPESDVPEKPDPGDRRAGK